MRATTYRTLLGVGAAALALIHVAPVAAQTVPPTGSDAPSDGAQASGEVAAQSDPLGDIVVTANKRAENVQSVGSAVSVIGGAALQDRKLDRITDYVALLPGVTANNAGTPGQSSITIRGISPLSAGSKVATYIDETPLGSSGIWAQAGGLTLDLLPFDLDRLELLRGPQGTLYGASSMGGLLKYVLNTPDTHRVHVDAGADLTTVEGSGKLGYTTNARISLPVVADVLAVSASGFYKSSPGYIDNVQTGRRDTNKAEQYGGRAALFLQAGPDVTVKLNALYQRTDSDDNAVESVAAPLVNVVAGQPRVINAGQPYGRRTQSNAFAAPFRNEVQYYSGTLDWDLGGVDLISATSWSDYRIRRLANRSLSNGTLLPLLGLPEGYVLGTNALGTKKFTQEVRLTSSGGSFFAWQLGGFYTHEDQSNVQTQDVFTKAYIPVPQLQPNASFITIPTTYKEYAAFGDVTLTFSPTFDVSGGLRYSRNDQVYDLSARGVLAGLPQLPLVTLPTIKSSEDNWTWSGGARYHVSRDVMVYVRAASGYAPGGANTPSPGVPRAVVESETLQSYEVGVKSEFLDRRVQINVSAFHIDWSNIQLGVRLGAVSYTDNAGSAKSDGFELASVVRPIAGMAIGLNAAYTDARLTKLKDGVTTAFLADRQLQNAPKLTLAGTFDYGWDLGSDWRANVGASARFVDEQPGAQAAVNLPLFTLPGYALADLRAGVDRGPYSLAVFVRNVTDARAYQGGSFYSDRAATIRQIDYYVSQPRTIGASATVRF